MSRPLFSERAGRSRALSQYDFAELIWRGIHRGHDMGLYAQAFHGGRDETGEYLPPRIRDADEFFLLHLKVRGIGPSFTRPVFWLGTPSAVDRDLDLLLDTIELLYRECVSLPSSGDRETWEAPFNKDAGQRRFRGLVNPLLGIHEPAYELLENGEVAELPGHGFERLAHDAIPPTEEPELRDPIEDAVEQFFRRGAGAGDRLAAVKRLADALERLRPQIKVEALPADEQALFHIANKFGIRHHDRGQRLDYNRDLWLEWIFYVYLATARAMIRLRDEERGHGE